MAKYLVLEKSYIGGTIVEEGETVEYDGEAGPNLQLVEAEPEAEPKSKGKH